MGILHNGVQSPELDAGQNHDRMVINTTQSAAAAARTVIPDNDLVEITTVQKMLSATSGSLVTGLLVTPLDVVRIRWQSQALSQPPTFTPLPAADLSRLAVSTSNAFRPNNLGVTACCREVFFMNNNSEVCVVGPRVHGASPAIECAVEQTQQRTFNSTFDGLRKIARNEGLTTLWRGLSPTLVMAVPANIIYLTGYDWLRSHPTSPIQRAAGLRDEYAPLVAGSVARTLAATAVSPIELFRTRLQAAQGGTSSEHLADTIRGVKNMVQQHGYRSLWRGLTLTLWRDVPFSAMYWWGYETIRGKLTDMRERGRGRSLELDLDRHNKEKARARRRSQSRENHADTFTDSFLAGAASGAFASVATMPFDVGKTRTQVFRDSTNATKRAASAAAAAPEEQSMTRLLWHIFRTEGVAGLWKGWIPRTLKVAPACAVMISSYEVGKRVFRGVNERKMGNETGKEDL
ncbi:mitochondrial carrier domain-containing protein [Cladorrhinum samala]|uniref:Mitochondrial carrier domain-containing protein n=1 Tax=Cladorrhinum samala TaxID=585594 RepID=A0AAV9HRW9_9PEZI|nr:mitochondrial carrier domain-containing protein [Cladorrhinum samala]